MITAANFLYNYILLNSFQYRNSKCKRHSKSFIYLIFQTLFTTTISIESVIKDYVVLGKNQPRQYLMLFFAQKSFIYKHLAPSVAGQSEFGGLGGGGGGQRKALTSLNHPRLCKVRTGYPYTITTLHYPSRQQ